MLWLVWCGPCKLYTRLDRNLSSLSVTLWNICSCLTLACFCCTLYVSVIVSGVGGRGSHKDLLSTVPQRLLRGGARAEKYDTRRSLCVCVSVCLVSLCVSVCVCQSLCLSVCLCCCVEVISRWNLSVCCSTNLFWLIVWLTQVLLRWSLHDVCSIRTLRSWYWSCVVRGGLVPDGTGGHQSPREALSQANQDVGAMRSQSKGIGMSQKVSRRLLTYFCWLSRLLWLLRFVALRWYLTSDVCFMH